MEIELKDFISESLTQIIEGIKTAEVFAKANGAQIAPTVTSTHPGIAYTGGRMSASSTSIIEFDVAVTASESAETSGKVGVLVAVLGAAVQGRSDVVSSTISRIKCVIPVTLPRQNQ